MNNPKTITIDDIKYVREDSIEKNVAMNDKDYVIIRTYSAGVHAGYLKSRNRKEVILLNSRRIWKWTGASSLSELAIKGSSNIDGCKIPCVLPRIILTEAIEIIQCSQIAKSQIEGAKEWTQH